MFGPRRPINNVVNDLGTRANGGGRIVDIDFVERHDHHLVNHHHLVNDHHLVNHHDHDRAHDHDRLDNNCRVTEDNGR